MFFNLARTCPMGIPIVRVGDINDGKIDQINLEAYIAEDRSSVSANKTTRRRSCNQPGRRYRPNPAVIPQMSCWCEYGTSCRHNANDEAR